MVELQILQVPSLLWQKIFEFLAKMRSLTPAEKLWVMIAILDMEHILECIRISLVCEQRNFLQQADFGQHWAPMPWVASMLRADLFFTQKSCCTSESSSGRPSSAFLKNLVVCWLWVPACPTRHVGSDWNWEVNGHQCTPNPNSPKVRKQHLWNTIQNYPRLRVISAQDMNLKYRGQRSSASHLLHLQRKPQLDSSRCRRTCKGTSKAANLPTANSNHWPFEVPTICKAYVRACLTKYGLIWYHNVPYLSIPPF